MILSMPPIGAVNGVRIEALDNPRDPSHTQTEPDLFLELSIDYDGQGEVIANPETAHDCAA